MADFNADEDVLRRLDALRNVSDRNSDEIDLSDENDEPALDALDESPYVPNPISYQDSGTPMGPEGGFRASQSRNAAPSISPAPVVPPANGAPIPTRPDYNEILAKLSKMRGEEKSQVSGLNMLRGGNQIAQAIASGYGGKIGDGSAQVDKLQEAAQQPAKDYKDLLKVYKNINPSARSTAIGFGQYNTIAGEPVVMLPNNTLWNMVKNAPHDPKDGLIPRAVDRFAVDPRSGEGFVFAPGKTSAPSQMISGQGGAPQAPVAAAAPMAPVMANQGQAAPATADVSKSSEQTPFDVKQKLNNHDRTILEKDIDQAQKAFEEPKRIVSEIDAISDSTIQLARKNPNAAKTLGAQIAKIMQGSRLTDADVSLYTGRTGIANWIGDFITEASTGTISDQKAADLKQTLTVYNDALRKALKVRANQYANQVKNQFDPNLGLDTNAISKLYYVDDKPNKLAQAKEWLKKNQNSPDAKAVQEKIMKMESGQ